MLTEKALECELLSIFSCISQNYEVLLSMKVDKIVITIIVLLTIVYVIFFSFVETLLVFTNDNVVLGGDINVNMLHDDSSRREISMIMNSYGCGNVIILPTRITANLATLADLYIASYDCSNVKAGVMSSTISDHLKNISVCSKTEC